MAFDNAYTLTIRVSDDVEPFCFQHDYLIRNNIKLRCNLDTPQPTSHVPTTTVAPTTPSIAPTMPTLNPTRAPTLKSINCSTNDARRYCYFEDVYANTENQTITSVQIKNEDDYTNTFLYFDVNFTILNADCIDLKLTFTYEAVK